MDDKEIKAMSDILASLESLDAQARARVFNYVTERLKIITSGLPANNLLSENFNTPDALAGKASLQKQVFNDIRFLKESKNPDSSIQMTALVAYYLQEVASSEERKDSIDVDDIKKYFNQAGFPLPTVPKQALLNTKAAGYLESADRGRYKLNPVGYNLVAYGLPVKSGSANAKKTKKQVTKKKKSKK